jgi:ribosomal protein S3
MSNNEISKKKTSLTNCSRNILETKTKKKSFQQICRFTFQQIKKCPYVKGIRICCSSQLNGAKIAKIECKKYNENTKIKT